MTDPGVNTVQLNDWLARMRAGDAAARDESLRKLLLGFPEVKVHDCCPLSGEGPAKRGRGDPS
jgi:hypothetical protein